MKRIVCIILAMLIAFSFAVTSFAANNSVLITIDGKPVAFSADYGFPFIDENNRTQVPLRVVMEQFGCTVSWNNETRTATIVKGNTTVQVPIGEKYVVVNGQRENNDTVAVIRNSRTYLPIRIVLEAFGAKVDWQNGTVNISTSNSERDEIPSPYREILDELYDIYLHNEINDNNDLCLNGIIEAVTFGSIRNIGYSLMDIDRNGTEELMILGGITAQTQILAMYTIKNNEAIRVLDGWVHNRYYLLDDMTIYQYGSGGLLLVSYTTYRFLEDGVTLAAIDCCFSAIVPSPNAPSGQELKWYYNNTGTRDISKSQEFSGDPFAIRDSYESRIVQVMQQSIADYKAE